jgi:hypothetical protein
MGRIEARQVAHLIIAHKDRLARFGFPGWRAFGGFAANAAPNMSVMRTPQSICES